MYAYYSFIASLHRYINTITRTKSVSNYKCGWTDRQKNGYSALYNKYNFYHVRMAATTCTVYVCPIQKQSD